MPEGKYAFLKSTSEHLPLLPHQLCWWYRDSAQVLSVWNTGQYCLLTVQYCFRAPLLCSYDLVKSQGIDNTFISFNTSLSLNLLYAGFISLLYPNRVGNACFEVSIL